MSKYLGENIFIVKNADKWSNRNQTSANLTSIYEEHGFGPTAMSQTEGHSVYYGLSRNPNIN